MNFSVASEDVARGSVEGDCQDSAPGFRDRTPTGGYLSRMKPPGLWLVGDSGLSIFRVSVGCCKEISYLGEKLSLPKMSQECAENDVGSLNCQMPSINCAILEGSLVAARKREWRRYSGVKKAGSGSCP